MPLEPLTKTTHSISDVVRDAVLAACRNPGPEYGTTNAMGRHHNRRFTLPDEQPRVELDRLWMGAPDLIDADAAKLLRLGHEHCATCICERLVCGIASCVLHRADNKHS